MPSKIYQTYKKIEQITIKCKFFVVVFGDFFLTVSFDFLYEITLSSIDRDSIVCLELFFPL